MKIGFLFIVWLVAACQARSLGNSGRKSSFPEDIKQRMSYYRCPICGFPSESFETPIQNPQGKMFYLMTPLYTCIFFCFYSYVNIRKVTKKMLSRPKENSKLQTYFEPLEAKLLKLS